MFVMLCIGFGFCLLTVAKSQFATHEQHIFTSCQKPAMSHIGVVYLGLVFDGKTLDELKYMSKPHNLSTFKLNNFYTLTLLTKLFDARPTDRIVFLHPNDYLKNVTNHYNRWFNDKFWSDKVPMANIKFIHLDYSNKRTTTTTTTTTTAVNYFSILQKVINEADKLFDVPKSHVILVTGDTVVGPKILTCLSLDLSDPLIDNNGINSQYHNIGLECYQSVHRSQSIGFSYYSLLYQIKGVHEQHSLSGILVWQLNSQLNVKITYNDESMEADGYDDKIRLDIPSRRKKDTRSIFLIKQDKLVSPMNVHKFIYKDKLSMPEAQAKFRDAYGIFGFEFNKLDAPNIEDAFTTPNYFYELIRYAVFGNTKPIGFEKKSTPLIPRIVHMVWYGEKYKHMKLVDYLSLKSVILILKPDKVKIHGDVEPYGTLWDSVKQHPIIEWVQRDRPLNRYGQNFENAPIQHLADIARLEIMYEEGGLYTDFDVLWVKPVDELLYVDAELVVSNDITSYCFEFPNNIQIGAFLAPAKSKFIKDWLDGYRDYHLYPNDYTAISMCEPYKLYEKSPHRVYIENRLQMIYFNGWSMFIPRFRHDGTIEEFNKNMNWLNNGTYGYHLPRHAALFSLEQYEKSDKARVPIQIATFIYDLPF